MKIKKSQKAIFRLEKRTIQSAPLQTHILKSQYFKQDKLWIKINKIYQCFRQNITIKKECLH
jgi:hypothetical protein